jgi:hypothetical protein
MWPPLSFTDVSFINSENMKILTLKPSLKEARRQSKLPASIQEIKTHNLYSVICFDYLFYLLIELS